MIHRLGWLGEDDVTRYLRATGQADFVDSLKHGDESTTNAAFAWFVWEANSAPEPPKWFDWGDFSPVPEKPKRKR
jgi:hypothetical protein